MSQYTIQVDQFLLNKLQPEIDKLNLSLISMEESGYDNRSLRSTRDKLNKLITTYDFLKEYAYGDEELDLDILMDIMKIVGSYSLSTKTHTPIIQSTRDDIDLNERGCLDFIRVYINDEISKSEVLPPLSEYTTLKVYAADSTESISVIFTETGSTPVTYTGVDHVTIPDVSLDAIDGITLAITTVSVCGETTVTNISYTIQDVSCSAAIYWIGNTTERFKISVSDLNESSDITIDPNSGTNAGGTELTYTWIDDSAAMTEYMYREPITQTISVEIGDSHALLLVPITLEIVDVEEIVSGTPVDMTEGLHYDSFAINSPTLKQYNCYYFRDLTSLTFPARTFQFKIQKI